MTQINPRLLVIFGTRPEAIKLFPVVHALRSGGFTVQVCVTAQHREMLDQVLNFSGIKSDYDLDLMRPGQTLEAFAASALTAIGEVLVQAKPDRVIVQGDTTTAMTGALAAFYRKIPVAHVEAGLRSGDIYAPWPEEVNRKIISTIADLHFAPTDRAARALAAEGIAAERIHVTGNTVIDALHWTQGQLKDRPSELPPLPDGKRIILVTAHRRESFGEGLAHVANALRTLAARGDVEIIYPLHPNPAVMAPMRAALEGVPHIHLISALDYLPFVEILGRCDFVLTDSGGIQEEAPALGKPVLVMRDVTERPEGVESGTARLVGTDFARIVSEATRLLDDRNYYNSMAHAHNPFGDGKASAYIIKAIQTAHQ